MTKWDILRGTTYKNFRYDKFYHKQDAEAFVKDLLASLEVLREIIAGGSGGDDLEVASFSCRAVRATVTSMAFFDKLLGESGIVRSNGLLVKCMDDYYEGFHVQDRLREILLNEDNEYELDHGEVFGEEDKGELLFKIFRHLCVGGSLCQFEDSLDPYLEVAKAVYKELLTVWRNPKSGKAEVASGAYEVGDVKLRRRRRLRGGGGGGDDDDGGGGGDGGGDGDAEEDEEEERDYFKEWSTQNWFYVTTDPFRRTCKVWIHRFEHHW